MLVGTIAVWVFVAALATFAHFRRPSIHKEVVKIAWDQFRLLAVRLPLALLAAGALTRILPQDFIAAKLGSASGFEGVFLGSVFGAILPGGPIVTFPIVVLFMKSGATAAPLVALVTSWSVLAMHRVLIYEMPLMGLRFVGIRVASSIILPPIAGVLAGLLLG
jgi:uncharacterized membrane protein YraQ (UPF0718 family)